MKKIAFVFAFAAAITSSHYSSADNLCRQQNENIDSWKFIEYKLITAPQSLSRKGHLLRFIPALLNGFITGCILNVDQREQVTSEEGSKFVWKKEDYISEYFGKEISDSARSKITALASTLSASLIYGFIDAITQQIVDAKTIHSFITQWPEYKKYTPPVLQPIFDDVYEMYLFDPSSKKYKNNAADALIIAREYIEGHFPETYGKKGKYNCTKYIAKNILNSAPVKMVVNTLKLFV